MSGSNEGGVEREKLAYEQELRDTIRKDLRRCYDSSQSVDAEERGTALESWHSFMYDQSWVAGFNENYRDENILYDQAQKSGAVSELYEAISRFKGRAFHAVQSKDSFKGALIPARFFKDLAVVFRNMQKQAFDSADKLKSKRCTETDVSALAKKIIQETDDIFTQFHRTVDPYITTEVMVATKHADQFVAVCRDFLTLNKVRTSEDHACESALGVVSDMYRDEYETLLKKNIAEQVTEVGDKEAVASLHQAAHTIFVKVRQRDSK